ncbi:ThiF family adenylyltransferase [Flavobacterium subsaxonicum]|uniref:Uncharacterized protein n=1 Tax=Flavobacterium subsaxonicum WB 4.1-42 = DSM 21790 TaxID=1121898 RepID=A0A0A2MU26_9FLAO|nr:ThiF family adenylyltransferase [Flavobacterium subsaxonicum]KGO95111.1 hypothetical protein Q766_03140 [Flavobacterium subsaxonicum WB 4.1-42 = DSM 21790]
MWYIDNPDRWVREQHDLQVNNIAFDIDEELKKQGILRLNLEITEQSNFALIPNEFLPIKLTAVFPSSYPYFRPEIYAEEINLPRHQNIIDKNLCLLPRLSSYWMPQSTLVEYLKEQLPKVLTEGVIIDSDILKANADEQAEPVSEYYPSINNASIIFDTTVFDTVVVANHPVELIGKIKLGIPLNAEVPTRMVALESFDLKGDSLGKLPEEISTIFPSRMTGFVYRLKERPPYGDANKDYNWLIKLIDFEKKDKFLKANRPVTLKKGHTIENVVGITFPEEHVPGSISWGWLFIITVTQPLEKKQNGRNVSIANRGTYYSKVNRISLNELNFRNPSLKLLSGKKVVVFGLGALGAPSVIEFAKNGIGEITLIDFDTISAGTIVRWPLGVMYAGMFKTDALERFLNENYPYIKINKFNYRVGIPEVGIRKLPIDLSNLPSIEEIISGASLIYDATAETGVSHYLSEEAKKRDISFLSIYGTPGVWGGVVMRYIPKLTKGCWMCFQYALKNGDIPHPPTNLNGNVQAVGCGDITFTGTSFELDNIVSAGVRLAIGTICKLESGYADMPGDIGILSLIDDHGNPIFPKWTTHQLTKHPDCPYCNKE